MAKHIHKWRRCKGVYKGTPWYCTVDRCYEPAAWACSATKLALDCGEGRCLKHKPKGAK